MSSTLSNARRTPQPGRGERRVAQLLEAASSVMAEVGYEAATMTSIAERAGASIGTLYQYFPDKDAVVDALRRQHFEEMEEQWIPLTAQTSKMSLPVLVDRIVDMIVEYIEKRPAYLPVMGAPGRSKRDLAARNRLREHFATLFRERQPAMSREDAFRVANVTVQTLKGMNPLFADAAAKEREAIVREFKTLLLGYLSVRLKTR